MSAGTSLICIKAEIHAPELKQEPFCSQQEPYEVSRNPLWLAGTLGGQQEPLVIAETMHSSRNPQGQQEPLVLAGTMHGNSNLST